MINSYSEALSHWDGKPYFSLNSYIKKTFNEKLYKVSLDGGMSCPNRDGTLGYGGCIFCSEGGSGDFAGDRTLDIETQFEQSKTMIAEKHHGKRYIAYFQAFTNTYAPVERLRSLFMPLILRDDVAVLSIATRPDCLPNEVIDLLSELNQIKPVWVEIGLQTIHESTAAFINRGYPLSVFENAVDRLQSNGIEVIVHTILGLPGESHADILATHRYLAAMNISGIKLQLLHVLDGTELGRIYRQNPFHIMTLPEYSSLVIDCIELLPENIVIHRITGDGSKKILIAPTWSGHKKNVLNTIHHTFKERAAWQGRCHRKEEKS